MPEGFIPGQNLLAIDAGCGPGGLEDLSCWDPGLEFFVIVLYAFKQFGIYCIYMYLLYLDSDIRYSYTAS